MSADYLDDVLEKWATLQVCPNTGVATTEYEYRAVKLLMSQGLGLLQQAQPELAQLRTRIEELENEKFIHCGVPLGYHPEEDVTDWCDKPAATGICGDHWNEFMKLTRKPTLPLPPKKE